MTRIMFPFLLLVALAAQAMGVLNASNQFGVPAMASTFFNIGSVGFGVVLGYLAGPALHLTPHRRHGDRRGARRRAATGLAVAVPAHRWASASVPAFDWTHPGLLRNLPPDGPGDPRQRRRADQRDGEHQFRVRIAIRPRLDGPVSWLGYAFRFMQLPLGLFGVAIASATLPSISRSAAAGNMDEFRRTLSKSLGMVFLLTLPSSVGLVVLGRSIIGAIYQGGKFSALRHAADRAGALLLRDRPGRLRRAESAESRRSTRWTTRARRCW